MQGTRIVLRTSVWRLAFRAAFIRSQRDVARLSTPRARYLATSFPIGMEARTPPLAETPDPSLGVENPAQQEEKEKPDHTPDEDTQKKKKMRIKKKKLKTKAYQSRSMDLGLAEMPFSQADIRAAFEIPNPHSKKAKNKRKIKDQSENDNEDASKKIKRVNYFVSLPITNAKILGDIQTFQDAVVQKDGRLSRALSRKGSFHITLFVMRLENEDEVNLAISALLECKRPVEKVLQEKELVFSFHGVADFKNEVVYGKMTEDEYKSSLKEITEIMEKIFKEKGVHTEGKKGFIPHLTFMKMSRAPKLRKQGLKKINPNLYKDFQDHCFGKETLFRLDLCSMLKQRQACGYYHTEASIFFDSSSDLNPKGKQSLNEISVSGPNMENSLETVPSAENAKSNVFQVKSADISSNISTGSCICNHKNSHSRPEDSSKALTFFCDPENKEISCNEKPRVDPRFKVSKRNARRRRKCNDDITEIKPAHRIGEQEQPHLGEESDATSQTVPAVTPVLRQEPVSQGDSNQCNVHQLKSLYSLGLDSSQELLAELVSLQKQRMHTETEQWESNNKTMNLVLERLVSVQDQQRCTNKNLQAIHSELAYIVFLM
uniref:A-kinase anchor protein 7-like phosphoesterase domain-containing protein n=1 Tax=Leptobrachium leishanense TaxID=445787 RepID=A0A8C5M8X0_9ANUR